MNRYLKIFGIGPVGALISLILFGLAFWIDGRIGHLPITGQAGVARAGAILFLLLGAGLHLWTMKTLKGWWQEDDLCTQGPFRFFRHPMYAAWISAICVGVALWVNSWVMVLWVAALHPVWHRLVLFEETMMHRRFGAAYDAYAKSTGRFLPKIHKRKSSENPASLR